jgi:hypothetical protein
MIILTPTERILNKLLDCATNGAEKWAVGKQQTASSQFQKAIEGIQQIRYIGYSQEQRLSIVQHDLARVAQIQAECGAVDDAIDVLNLLTLPSPRFQVLMVLAPALVHASKAGLAETLIMSHRQLKVSASG